MKTIREISEIRGSSSLVTAVGFLLIAACAPMTGFAAVDDTPDSDNAPAYPPAEQLLSTVTASLPAVPVLVKAQIQSRNAGGEVERSFGADMRLDWHGRPPSAKYTINDAFGDTLEGLNIVWPEAGPRELRYFKGDPPVAAKLENLYGAIQGTDIGWTDLSLSYLWWRGGKTVGAEKIKGRYCYIVDLRAPAGEAGEYAGVRLWIDPQIKILLQAAAYDAQGQLVKMLEVKSFKKIRGVWIIQNLDVQSFPIRHKTTLRVKEASVEGEGKK
jgi:hypothetical protein